MQTPVARPDRQLTARRAGLVILPRARVVQRARRGIDLEQPRRVAARDAVAHRRAFRVRRRNRAQRDTRRAPVRVLRQGERIALLPEDRRLRHHDTGRRHVGHRHLVGALAGRVGAGRDVVGAALRCGERHPAVDAVASVVVRRAPNEVARGIVNAAQIGIAERAVARRAALQVDPVGLARLQLHREPVAVPRSPDRAGRRAVDRDNSRSHAARRQILAERLGNALLNQPAHGFGPSSLGLIPAGAEPFKEPSNSSRKRISTLLHWRRLTCKCTSRVSVDRGGGGATTRQDGWGVRRDCEI